MCIRDRMWLGIFWLVLSWPAGWMRCASIRRCLDDLMFHVLKWPVELCTLILHLLYVQLILRVARWRGQILVDLILSSVRSNNAARVRTRSFFFLRPWKAHCRQVFWDILCARQERNSNNLSLTLSIFGIKTARTSNKRLLRAARFHIYKIY